MKAKDYFKEYRLVFEGPEYFGLTEDDIRKEIAEKFCNEVDERINNGEIETHEQCVDYLIQQNEKWNALVKIFKNQCGSSPIKKNDFRRKIVPSVESWGVDICELK